MDEAAAQARIESMVDSAVDPVLTSDEIASLVDVSRRPDQAGNPATNLATVVVWAAATAYAYGDVVTPDPADGRYWMCTNAATSGATQPSWPDQVGSAPGGTTVYDGDLVWLDVGTTWQPTWDLNAGAAEGWRLKAGKVAGRYDFGTDGQMFKRGQMLAHCNQMERRYRRRIARGL